MEADVTANNSLAVPASPGFVVGIGASAGGLEALQRLFESLPADTGMSFVVIQHLSPDFKSLMDELLSRYTEMPVYRVIDGMQIQPNSVYLLPPGKEMIISNGRLLLTDKDPKHALALPTDRFFRSLAQDVGKRSIAIVLSGTGSDGSRGVVDVREAGGLVIVQDPETAKFDGMPKSAIETGAVDLVLSPEEIAQTLMRCADHRLTTPAEAPSEGEFGLKEILRLLRESYGLDFTLYKPTTVLRRIERRLLLQRVGSLEEYCRQLQNDPDELNHLYRDLLIGVTQFFRDKEAFEVLDREVLPELLDTVPPDQELRMWVAGCATGEEAYSLAMLVHEHLTAAGRPLNVKIFATDVHRASLDVASSGEYPVTSLANVSRERLERYFRQVSNGNFRVVEELRNLIVFAPHNVITDAPFTRLDLISCRNLLIYFQPAAQKKVLSLFHFALKPGGILMLGPSEGPGDLSDEFDALEHRWKIFRKRRDVRLATDFRMPLLPAQRSVPALVPSFRLRGSSSGAELMAVYDQLLEQFMPPALLIDPRGNLVHVFGGAGRFLSFADGRPSGSVLDQFPVEIRTAVVGSLQRLRRSEPVVFRRIGLQTVSGMQMVDVGIRQVRVVGSDETYVLLTFADAPQLEDVHARHEPAEVTQGTQAQIEILEAELRYTRENLQATIEELETSNEELQATNEELVASNEELQSTNEELHSVNEELYTVNAEYQRKIEELTELTADMENLFASTQVHTIFVDKELCIRKFTPKIAETFHLVAHDIGRRIDAFSPAIRYAGLIDDIRQVIDSGETVEREVEDVENHCYLLRILPYHKQGAIEGAVITLIDITARRRSEALLEETNRRVHYILENSPSAIFLKDLEGRYTLVSREFERAFGRGCDEFIGHTDEALFPVDAAQRLIEHQQAALQAEGPVEFEEILPAADGTNHVFLSTNFAVRDEDGQPIAIGGIKTDISLLKRAETRAINALSQRDRFLAVLSHELRNPLGALVNAVRLLTAAYRKGETNQQALEVLERQTEQIARLLDDLLDVARVTAGKISLRMEPVDLRDVLREAIETVQPQITEHRHELIVDLPVDAAVVRGDRVRLLQVVENLLTNAAKYTQDGGRIEAGVSASDGKVALRVRDNGRGIDPKLLSSVFDMFVQSDETLHRADGGMGVGLTLVKSLVELHGGTIHVSSDGLGQGSEFVVTLPRVDGSVRRTDDAHRGDQQALAPHGGTGGSARIVVVEDEDDNREMLRQLLELEGATVLTASNGRQGLELILRERPRAALIDIGLPLMDGYEVATRVRETLGENGIWLAALTGYGRAEDRERVKKAGFDHHFIKPLRPDDVALMIRACGAAPAAAASRDSAE